MIKWEYLNVVIRPGLFSGGPKYVTKELKPYGDEGWEMVNFQFVPDVGMCFVFKRPIED